MSLRFRLRRPDRLLVHNGDMRKAPALAGVGASRGDLVSTNSQSTPRLAGERMPQDLPDDVLAEAMGLTPAQLLALPDFVLAFARELLAT